ncbi:hypothetical protein HDU93_000513 [Gonapodya sp. JEL0774]|nr:hypothetical protein HDU93_000513 [Gonapodya sp. JEL0774]
MAITSFFRDLHAGLARRVTKLDEAVDTSMIRNQRHVAKTEITKGDSGETEKKATSTTDSSPLSDDRDKQRTLDVAHNKSKEVDLLSAILGPAGLQPLPQETIDFVAHATHAHPALVAVAAISLWNAAPVSGARARTKLFGDPTFDSKLVNLVRAMERAKEIFVEKLLEESGDVKLFDQVVRATKKGVDSEIDKIVNANQSWSIDIETIAAARAQVQDVVRSSIRVIEGKQVREDGSETMLRRKEALEELEALLRRATDVLDWAAKAA